METEQRLARYAVKARYQDLPAKPLTIARRLTLTIAGTVIAGSKAEGCEAVVDQVRRWGGAGEATVLVHGGKVPAHNAVLEHRDGARPRLLRRHDAGLHLAAVDFDGARDRRLGRLQRRSTSRRRRRMEWPQGSARCRSATV
jgi:hypothetical protein